MTPAVVLALGALAQGDGLAATSPSADGTTGEPPAKVVLPSEPRYPNIVVPTVHGLALMTVMRTAETFLWPDPFAKTEQFGPRYREAFTTPPKLDTSQPFMRWDGDPLVVNALGHGLFGSELYLRARQCRFGWGGSAVFAAATSAVWEYGFEANGARPSALDLVYTPLAGAALGELRYWLHRAAGRFAPPARIVVRTFVDPFGELERAAGTSC